MDDKAKVKEFYDTVGDAYDVGSDMDGPLYPSNRTRVLHCLDVLAKAGVHRVLDAGCGTGLVLKELLDLGYDAHGFDLSEEAAGFARDRLLKAGYDPNLVWVQDIEAIPDRPDVPAYFDAALAIGPLAHLADIRKALEGLYATLRTGGLLLVEHRNAFFNLYAMNDGTVSFLKDIMPQSPESDFAVEMLKELLPYRLAVPGDTHNMTAVPSVWENPLTIDAKYRAAGFKVVDKLWFHWHAQPPQFEPVNPAAYRKASLEMEWIPHDPRGIFMASAFILVAEKI